MSKYYTKTLIAVMEALDVDLPENIRADQQQAIACFEAMKTAAESIVAKEATGNAAVTDVKQGKTFSNATSISLTGTLVVPTIETLTADATATAADIMDGKTAYSQGVELTGIVTLAALTGDADATAEDIATGKTAYVNGVLLTGTHV